MDWKKVKSSNLNKVAYDKKEKKLYIEFKNNTIYSFDEVPESLYKGLLKAPSKGKYFWNYIRDIYDYERIK